MPVFYAGDRRRKTRKKERGGEEEEREKGLAKLKRKLLIVGPF